MRQNVRRGFLKFCGGAELQGPRVPHSTIALLRSHQIFAQEIQAPGLVFVYLAASSCFLSSSSFFSIKLFISSELRIILGLFSGGEKILTSEIPEK